MLIVQQPLPRCTQARYDPDRDVLTVASRLCDDDVVHVIEQAHLHLLGHHAPYVVATRARPPLRCLPGGRDADVG